MLHKVFVPDCKPALDWIVRLQQDLLLNLCLKKTNSVDVTNASIKNLRKDLPEDWINRFCSWKYENRQMIEHMGLIADEKFSVKKQIVSYFINTIKFHNAFNPASQKVAPIKQISEYSAFEIFKTVKHFLEAFYSRVFYEKIGYPIGADGQPGTGFNRNQFIRSFELSNPDLGVCPLCDGGMDGCEVDHWLSKKKYPALACYPLNLIPICGTCNSTSNKGEKPPLDLESTDQFENWFHPYLRPAVDFYTIDFKKGIPILSGKDDISQRRVRNIDSLINLSNRWSKEYKLVIKSLLRRIDRKQRFYNQQNIDLKKLNDWIEDWHLNSISEISVRPNKILESQILSQSMNENYPIFQELRDYCEDLSI